MCLTVGDNSVAIIIVYVETKFASEIFVTIDLNEGL